MILPAPHHYFKSNEGAWGKSFPPHSSHQNDCSLSPHVARTAVLDPDDDTTSQRLGRRLREAGSNGVTYPSVRHRPDPNPGTSPRPGNCIGAFRPTAVHPPTQERHLRHHYNGTRISRWFDYGTETWHER